MKVKAFAKMMNDHGTKPHIKVMYHNGDHTLLAYEGKPDNIDEEVADMKVNSFTVLGTGYMELHTSK